MICSRNITCTTLFVSLGVTMVGARDMMAGESSRPAVGAIRWDAWSGGRVTQIVEGTLGPKRYHHRLPWFAEVTGEDSVRIAGASQEIMDREIAWAAEAGLDYWAFVMYPKDAPMSVSLTRYLASAQRKRVGFCMILHNNLNVPDAQLPAELERAVALLAEPGYQRLPDGRPLVYYFECKQWQAFLKAARAAGHDPYLVAMNWNLGDYAGLKGDGVSAMSAYAVANDQPAFAQLAARAEKQWQQATQKSIPWVPLVTAGWDKRPRQDNPVPWERKDETKVWPAPPTPTELAEHLRRALAFVTDNPAICPARTVIIYAWNEYDEGGWIAPTRGLDGQPDDSRLKAIGRLLNTPTKKPAP